jgi:hypothetical protein
LKPSLTSNAPTSQTCLARASITPLRSSTPYCQSKSSYSGFSHSSWYAMPPSSWESASAKSTKGANTVVRASTRQSSFVPITAHA